MKELQRKEVLQSMRKKVSDLQRMRVWQLRMMIAQQTRTAVLEVVAVFSSDPSPVRPPSLPLQCQHQPSFCPSLLLCHPSFGLSMQPHLHKQLLHLAQHMDTVGDSLE